MIISYLTRLILILTEITSIQANRLTEIIKAQEQYNPLNENQILSNAKIDNLLGKTKEKLAENAIRMNISDKKLFHTKSENKREFNTKSATPCLPINETLRKKLIQVYSKTF